MAEIGGILVSRHEARDTVANRVVSATLTAAERRLTVRYLYERQIATIDGTI
jgi:hypothetical protein